MSLNTAAESVTTEKPLFWRRQFAGNRTEAQQVFDVVFGLIAPILCFYFDPIVFKGEFVRESTIQSYQLFAYGVTAVEVSVLAVWLLFGTRLGGWSQLVGGVLISGSVFSAAIGVAILPLTIIGLILVIGVFGFIPFVTAFVYLRVGWRALKSEEETTPASWANALLMGAILSLVIPALGSLYVSRTASHSIDIILHGSPEQAQVALTRLRKLPLIPRQDLEPLVQAYMVEKDSNRKETLKDSYRLLTGENIDTRIAIMND
jgi:hypothetical protein